jgi:very-short-patch-repair endonuclease
MRRVPDFLTANARTLRNGQTDVERLIWRRISRYRPRFTRQLVVGPYIVDLACRSAKLAVEFDGVQHLEAQDYDGLRTAFLIENGWTMLRFWNSEVADNPDGVVEAILLKAAECLGGTHPQPLPSREGRRKS